MNQSRIWLSPGIFAFYGAALDTVQHSHDAIQITWSNKESQCQIGSKTVNGSLIINRQVEHQLTMPNGWVILIEPQSQLGQLLLQKLENSTFISFRASLAKSNPEQKSLALHLEPVLKVLDIPLTYLTKQPISQTVDHRVSKLISKLNQCLESSCIKPTSWRAKEIAKEMELSESRFLHLFKQEAGIAWRPYLLWRRLICAVNELKSNKSATEAAHTAGFSDSAHLSRTFKKIFGLSVREAKKLFTVR